MKIHDTIKRALNKIQRKEQNYLEKSIKYCKMIEKISIPQKVQSALTVAFTQGLSLVMEKGDTVIRRGICETEIQQTFLKQDQKINKKIRPAQLYVMGVPAKRVRRRGSAVVFAEGIGLGALGIGLPDIPLFLGMLLRGIYQIALSYGIDVRQEGEQIYLLLLLACAGKPEQERQERLDKVAQRLQTGEPVQETLQFVRVEAAQSLAQGMLTAKFIQSFPLVGMVGGMYNLPVYQQITEYAVLQYQKRYLWRLSERV